MPKLKETITIKSFIGYISALSTLFAAGYGFHVYMLKQQQQIIDELRPQFEQIDEKLISLDAKLNNGFNLTYIRDTMQIGAFDRYRIQQSKGESQRIQVLSEILKQVKEREPYFIFSPDTSKKKVYMSNR